MATTITAAVSVYNGEKFIIRCLSSIVKQTRHFDRVIIYNDASTDGTVSVVESFINKHPNSRMELINSDINRGPGGGKNYIKNLVTSDYFTFVDADDYIGPYYLENLLKALKEGDEDIVFGGFCEVDSFGKRVYRRSFESIEKALIGGFQNWGNLYSKLFFQKNQIDIPEGKVLEDVLTRAVIVSNSPKCEVAKGICDYYHVDNCKSVSRTYMNKFIPGVMELEMEYLKNNLKTVPESTYELYEYCGYKVLVWHLLKSGAGVGWKAMKQELNIGYGLFSMAFPNYKKNIYIKNKAPKGERLAVKIAIKCMYLAEQLGLKKLLMFVYSSIDVSFLWPST